MCVALFLYIHISLMINILFQKHDLQKENLTLKNNLENHQWTISHNPCKLNVTELIYVFKLIRVTRNF